MKDGPALSLEGQRRSRLERTHDRLVLTVESPLARQARDFGAVGAGAGVVLTVLSVVVGLYLPVGIVVAGVGLASVLVGLLLSRWAGLACLLAAALFYAMCQAWLAVEGAGAALAVTTSLLAPWLLVLTGCAAVAGISRDWRHQIELTADRVRIRGPVEGVLRRDALRPCSVHDRLVIGPGLVFQVDDDEALETFLAEARRPAQAPPLVEAPEEARRLLERVGVSEVAPAEPPRS